MCESNFKLKLQRLSKDGQKSWWILMDLGDIWRGSVGSLKVFFICFMKQWLQLRQKQCRKTLWQLFCVDALNFWWILKDFPRDLQAWGRQGNTDTGSRGCVCIPLHSPAFPFRWENQLPPLGFTLLLLMFSAELCILYCVLVSSALLCSWCINWLYNLQWQEMRMLHLIKNWLFLQSCHCMRLDEGKRSEQVVGSAQQRKGTIKLLLAVTKWV